MNNFSTRAEMLDAFANMQKKFDNAKYHNQLTLINESFAQDNAKVIQKAKDGLSIFGSDNPLVNSFINAIDEIGKSNQKIIDDSKKMISSASFRESFQNSLVILVYGKVKSGKSSLGNYLAWGSPSPTPEIQKQAKYKPVYKTIEQNDVSKGGDDLKQAERDNAFKVGVTETTSSIQTFSLPGLTWVDVPGVHSIRKDNENLAQEYVKHADLVLYTLSSENPGRSSDIDELSKVINDGKDPILIITKFDYKEEDVDENDNIIQTLRVKDNKTKILQTNAVINAIKAKNIDASNMRVIPVSAMYAYKYNKDINKLKESGVSELFDVLKDIAENKAFKLKMMEPIKTSQAILNNLKQEFIKHQQYINSIQEKLHQQLSTFNYRLNMQKTSLVNSLNSQIDMQFVKISQAASTNKRNVDQSAINQKMSEAKVAIENTISQLVSNALLEQLQDFSINLGKELDTTWIKDSSNLNLQYSLDVEHVRVASSVSHKSGWGMIGAIAGGTIGFLTGGPLGAAAGVAAGGMLGNKVNPSSNRINYDDRTVVKGDNLQELIQKCKDFYGNALTKYLESTINLLINDVNVQAEKSVKLINNSITKTLEQISVLERELQEKNNRLLNEKIF